MPKTLVASKRRPCVICKKQCEPWHRNSDGTYIHDACSKQLTIQEGWDRPATALPSADAKKEGK